MNFNELQLKTNIQNSLNMLSNFYGESESEILKTGIITNIAFETMPNYKNYSQILSGISQARMMKGVKGRNYVESQVTKLFDTYDLEDINNEILEKSMELIMLTFDSIHFNSKEKTKVAFFNALDDPEFLYINLRLAVKIVAETLRRNKIELNNLTLQYITDQIKKEKSDIAREYIEAYLSGDERELMLAKTNYREKMESMLNDVISKTVVPYEKVNQIAKENEIVKRIGKENLDFITILLLVDLKEKILENKSVQLRLF